MGKLLRFLLLFRNPLLAIKDRLALIRAPLVLHGLRNGLSFWCRPGSSDLMSVWDIFTSQNHSRYFAHFRPKPGDLVIDIGANIGVFSLQCAMAGAHVIAYEPMAETCRVLALNAKTNEYHAAIEIIRAGIANSSGPRKIHLGARGHSMACSFYSSDLTTQDAIEIETVSFREAIAPHRRIDILKIDCEGAEFEFFRDLPPGSLSNVRTIVLEYHEVAPGFNFHSLRREMEAQGYAVTHTPWKPGFGILYAWREA